MMQDCFKICGWMMIFHQKSKIVVIKFQKSYGLSFHHCTENLIIGQVKGDESRVLMTKMRESRIKFANRREVG